MKHQNILHTRKFTKLVNKRFKGIMLIDLKNAVIVCIGDLLALAEKDVRASGHYRLSCEAVAVSSPVK